MKNILVTGGAGFIGSNFVRLVLERRPEARVVNLDLLTYAGNPENLAGLENTGRYEFVRGDICDGGLALELMQTRKIDTLINFAAESHVDRSILSGSDFVRTNTLGAQTLLEAASKAGQVRFVQVSTDEVYGSLGERGRFTEESPLAPNSPYSASKAAADLLCRAYGRTFGVPVIITRCSNNYGPFQFPEKLIPLMIIKALGGEKLPVYGDGMHVRDWIHVEDHCAGLLLAAERGIPGEAYNMGGEAETTNVVIVKSILKLLGKPETLISYVKDRPGHDRRYAIDSGKAKRELGFVPIKDFETGLRETVQWYLANERWWRRVMSREYMDYCERNYSGRLER
ncbi:dTDP-glucose 4,6-dehydratase [bacterium]|nr:MAG: dTDP-glucose 4,6-dehydratase [bacterium]